MKKVVVLGAGVIGSYTAEDLAKDYEVTIADIDPRALDAVDTRRANRESKIVTDLGDPKTIEWLIKDKDLVVSALPEKFGFRALEMCMMRGKDIVDVSFWDMPRDVMSDQTELPHQSTAIIDFGIAPGWTSGEAAHLHQQLDGKTKSLKIYAGNIPKHRERVYFAAWSIDGILEEYKRSPWIVENGKRKQIPPLSVVEEFIFPGVGILEAVAADGLRTVAYNLDIPNMAEYAPRYQGHLDQMKALRDLGFLDDKHTASTRAVLKKAWKKDGPDIMVVRVEATDGETTITSDLYAEENKHTAVAYTTGGMVCLGARMILDGKFNHKGVFPAEKVIQKEPELIHYFTKGLEKLGAVYKPMLEYRG